MSFDLEAARIRMRETARQRQEALDRRYRRATADFKEIVEHIVRQYHPLRVYQWGSLLDKRIFSENSDIDIAVEGLQDAGAFFRLLGEADEMTDFPLDLIEMERIEPEFARIIKRKGRAVYDRTGPDSRPAE